MMETLYIDSNIFLNVLLEEEGLAASSLDLLQKVESGKYSDSNVDPFIHGDTPHPAETRKNGRTDNEHGPRGGCLEHLNSASKSGSSKQADSKAVILKLKQNN
jgi:hypothetical protein